MFVQMMKFERFGDIFQTIYKIESHNRLLLSLFSNIA